MRHTKKLYLTLSIILFSIGVSFAQQSTLPQLYDKFQTASHDTVRVYACLDIAKYYTRNNLDSALFYAQKALGLAESYNFQRGAVRCLIQLGILYKNSGQTVNAIEHFRKALPLARAQKMTPSVAAIYNNLGNTYQKFGQLDSAIIYLQKSLEIKLEEGDKEGIVNSCINIGIFYSMRREEKEAKRYYQLGLATERSLNQPLLRAKLMTNLGNALYETNHIDSALYYYNAALRIQSADQPDDMRFVYLNLGNIYMKKKDYKTALSFYNKSITVNQKAGDIFKVISALNNIGRIYRLQHQCEIALTYFERGMKEAERINSLDQITQLLYSISECHEDLNQSAAALDYYKNAVKTSDSLYNQQKVSILAEMQVKFETQRKEKELLEQKVLLEKKQHERNIVIVTAVALGLLLIVAVIFYMRKRADNKKLATQKAIIERREYEKGLLLRELHHRTKNNLQLVSSLLNLQAHQLKGTEAAHAVKEGQARVEAMALIHRDLYREENNTRVNLKNYLQNMVNNLISTYNYSRSSLKLTLEASDLELEADLAIPLGLIANELISNAFKHAFHQQQRPELFINVTLLSQNEICLLVRDNGKGISDVTPSGNSFGMNMIRSLVKQMQGTITFENSDGCVATLVVPLKKDELVEA